MKILLKYIFVCCLIVPLLGAAGCASWNHNKSAKSQSIFAFPKKKPAQQQKVQKDKDLPKTVGDFLQMERNDVL